ncbi:MAG TPA: BlaI/MecI/CopY family transcriptional regulator [Verrucomicrobiae bacterium]|nr:BlaI/MecI/CopY family transcriptional regulator [Verrucomicrobiae bacterium]
MKKPPRISDAEWTIMKVLWARSPASANQIIETPAIKRAMHPQVVRTLINRLVKKGVVGFKKEGRAHLFQPLVREADCVRAASKSFLARVFGGAFQPMLAHFLEHEELTDEDIEKLQRLLRKKKG